MFDKGKFRSAIRTYFFGGHILEGQVQGMEAIVDEFFSRHIANTRWLVYMLNPVVIGG